jgi:hypothetical protein
VEHQAERSEALTKGDVHLPRVRLVLEAHHEVVGIAHDDDVPVRVTLPPLMDPEVEYVVYEGVCEQRTDHSPNAKGNFQFERQIVKWRGQPVLDLRRK